MPARRKISAPSGATIVIIREDLLERCSDHVPDVWNYKSHINKQGMYNTPATYPIYIWGLCSAGCNRKAALAQMGNHQYLESQNII